MRPYPLGILAVMLAMPGFGSEPNAQESTGSSQVIDTMAIRTHTRFLSSDELRGRMTATPGADTAAEYIRAACEDLGLHPVGDGYLQPIRFQRAEILTGGTTLTLRYGGSIETHFASPADFTWDLGNAETLRGFSGPAVYVGANDEIPRVVQRVEVAGAAAVTVGPVRVDRAQLLADLGAVAMLQLIPDADQYEFMAGLRGAHRIYLDDSTVTLSMLPPLPSVLAGVEVTRSLLNSASRTLDGRPRFKHVVEVGVDTKKDAVRSSNVLCLLPGYDPNLRHEAILLSAHYDHLGIGVPDANGDSIYNGFSDNAAGVSMLLAIAGALQESDAPPRGSVIFAFFTGEEMGLLGSDYYVAHPTWPVERITAVVNLDAGAPPARPISWRIAGGDSSALGELAVAVAERRGWKITTSPATPNSDYYPFWRVGVPSIFVIPGPGPYEDLTVPQSDALRAKWDRYHQAGDEWSDDFPFDGIARYADFALAIVRQLENQKAGK